MVCKKIKNIVYYIIVYYIYYKYIIYKYYGMAL